jgi:uncharacterized protein (DUF427 family)
MTQAIWNDTVIADSDATVVVEGNHYFPEDSVRWDLLRPSDRRTVCPWKGTANYYDVTVDGKTNRAAVWQYQNPSPAARTIKGHVAFWHGVRVVRTPAAKERMASDKTTGLLRRLFTGARP